MKIWQQISGILKKPVVSKELGEGSRELFQKRYQSFQELLSKNNSVLELMADMEEKLSGEFPPDRDYIEHNTIVIADEVKKIIDELNLISKDKYHSLYDRFNKIHSEIEKLLIIRREIPVSSFTVPFDEINSEMTDALGNKNANLGEVRNRLGIPTPDGFAISAFAFKRFMEHNKLLQEINERLSKLSIEEKEGLNEVSKKIQDMVIGGEIPDDLENAIRNAVESLKLKVESSKNKLSPFNLHPSTLSVSVRSSAIQEDGEFSFAGQYSTFLNVPSDLILQKYKEVVASLFTPKAIFYYKTKGLHESEMVMSVGVLVMVDAKAGGVIYTKDPNNPDVDTLTINVVRGLGKCLVEGTVTPETYILSRGLEIIKKTIPEQKRMLVCRPDGEVEEVAISDDMKGKPCLSDEEIKVLAGYAVAIEDHYKYPQDIEWVIDRDGRPYIVQTRPLQLPKVESLKVNVPGRIEGYNILINRGAIASKGIGFGKAYIVRTDEDMKDFPQGAVLVAKNTSTRFVTLMDRTSAIITDVGGTTVHMATLAREFHIPTIVNTEVATGIIKNGQELTVDAINCNIYEGRVAELIEFSEKREGPFKDTRLFKTLSKVLKWIVPLNLIDPKDERFKPEFCETLHDIARFAHQKAMHEMFKISKEIPEDIEPVRLMAGIPVAVYIIDLGGGMDGAPAKPRPEHIRSIPFNALLKGLVSLEWPGPRHVDAKGFLGMVAHTASIPELELEQMGEESFSFISGDYMNFSIRLGYHLSVIEAYTGENINDNYIRFFFKGGGADIERRFRRVKLISEILKRMDFNVKVTEDVIDAIITKYKKSALEEKLKILGILTVYTKQLDALMYDDASVELHIKEFLKINLENKGVRLKVES